MITDPAVFRDLAFVFAAAVVGGALAWWARQPLILGYIFGGILVSPFTPGPSVTDVHTFDLFAEIGVVLLMFSVGIEFSLKDLLRVRWVTLLGGPVGLALCVGLGVGAGALLGWTALQGAVAGIVISVASTMVLVRLLLDRGELHSRHGRIMMGTLLIEDLAVVVLIVLIPALGALEPDRLVAIAAALGKAALVLLPFTLRFLVIELDPDIVKGLRARGVPCLFGDAANRRTLERAGAARATLVVVALPEVDRATLLVRYLRAMNPAVPVLVRAHHPSGMEALARAGATEVIQPELEAAATLIRHALRRLALPQDRVLAYLERFRSAMEMGEGARRDAMDLLPHVEDLAVGQGALADQSLREGRVRERLGVTVVAVTRADGEVLLNPDPETILRAGDLVRVFGLPEQIAAFRAETDGSAPQSPPPQRRGAVPGPRAPTDVPGA
ncbi:MAG: cation:proton antiporter [Candidatus Rokubacteria bacterium]|nr:cation:proton antiporter [Candidatus Rokubacteria bacterium]